MKFSNFHEIYKRIYGETKNGIKKIRPHIFRTTKVNICFSNGRHFEVLHVRNRL